MGNRSKGKARQRCFGFIRQNKPGKKFGRPRKKDAGVSHGARPGLRRLCPMHITVKLRDDLPPMRTPEVWELVNRVIGEMHRAQKLRVIEFTVQGDHLHLICEAAAKGVVSSGMISLNTRLAKGLNRLWDRKGPVKADRYHRVDLTTPTQVRNALRYVLGNSFKHQDGLQSFVGRGGKLKADPYSSGAWFTGFSERDLDRTVFCDVERSTAQARSWLLNIGWRKLGLLSVVDRPA